MPFSFAEAATILAMQKMGGSSPHFLNLAKFPGFLFVTICCSHLAWAGTFVHERNASSSSPWPSIPKQQQYLPPTGPTYVYPASIASGISESGEEGKTAGMVFYNTNDLFTLKYSESFRLAGTFRVETFNITKTGLLTGFFIQGAQRWQSIRLVKGNGLSISQVGFISSVDQTPVITPLDGSFASSDSTYTDIWALGPRTQQLAGELTNEIDAIQATGPYFILTSDYPLGSFGNIDRSLVPPNTLVVGRGGCFKIRQVSLEKTWHSIRTVSPGDQTYTIYLDDVEIAHFNISSYGLGDANPFIPGGASKGFAFGPWQDLAAYIRNVNATLATRENFYSNPITSEDVLVEYGVQTNNQTVCSDSSKRDRYSWLGDCLVSARTVMIGTGQYQFVGGPTMEVFSRQVSSGQVPISTLFSPLEMEGTVIRTTNLDPLLVDYQFDLMQIIYNYWMRSGSDSFIMDNWTNMVAVVSFAVSRSLDQGTQLYGAPFCTNGSYYASTLGASNYDMIDVAQVLLADIGTVKRREAFIGMLGALQVPAGYINSTRFFDTPQIVNPYYSSYLLEGFAKSGKTELAQNLLDASWGPMVRRDNNYTGAYWEYVSPDSAYPGLDLFTGQSHFWGSGPTAFLTEHVLGVRPTVPGYSRFLFAPLPGFNTSWVHGVLTPAGIIYAAWSTDSPGNVGLEINAPANTACIFVPPFNGAYTIGEKRGLSGNTTIPSGGVAFQISQD
ncbi:catalytic activity: RhaA is able to hydrolyze alpha-1 [Rhexocercosporidium sp. MPI-PUGE-AT-0058]|nr:catalytic activity: RhaA is able to hydrolyze alpha-1 [Rhexocercosporidium sp. MPI-PUGE-AT-0058]